MSDTADQGLDLTGALAAVLDLQPQWEWQNTPLMERRGDLVRTICPDLLRRLLSELDDAATNGIAIEGSDGAGRKARVPWVRLYSPAHSPKATKGFYLVLLFCGDGSGVFLSLNQGTTDPDAGYRARDRDYLRQRVDWARQELSSQGSVPDGLLTTIDLRDQGALAGYYEAGNVVAVYYPKSDIPDTNRLRVDLDLFLRALQAVYQAEGRLADLPEGFGPGEPLHGFSLPAPMTRDALATVPKVAGVHVFWDHEGRLLYVGETANLHDRLRQHASGERSGSILREKVGRILDQEVGRSVQEDEITAFLGSGTFSWIETDARVRLKARIMEELRPPLNDVKPVVKREAAKVIVVYVGQRAERNFQVGLETRTWGFKSHRDEYQSVEEGDWILLGVGYSGGSPRTNSEDWQSHDVERAILGRITKPPYEDHVPHWPDERLGEASYPFRLQFEVVDNVAPLDLGGGALISPEVSEALRLSAINRGAGYVVSAAGSIFSAEPSEGAGQAPVLDMFQICTEFAGAVGEANLQFGPSHFDFVRAFVVSLCTKGFALLTGLSGSGKTRIAIAFGQWLGVQRYLVVAVRPDWTGPEPLLGYEDALLPPLAGRRAWQAPDVLRFMLRAAADPKHPYLLVLDEMNLAHVERYFADLLSGMESGENVLPNLTEEADGFWRLPPTGPFKIPVPENLVVVGTVNVDETTFMFSPKVLDRANTLEFRVGSDDLRVDMLPPTSISAGTDALTRGFLAFATNHTFQATNPASNRDMLAAKLVDLHRALYRYGFEFGHRVFSESMRFAALLEAAGETNQWRALDLQVKQKVLPRMHGTTRRLTEPLTVLAQFCLDLSIPNAGAIALDVEAGISSTPALPDSFDKACRMLRSLRANQFASFSE